jgi:hypothetical protein
MVSARCQSVVMGAPPPEDSEICKTPIGSNPGGGRVSRHVRRLLIWRHDGCECAAKSKDIVTAVRNHSSVLTLSCGDQLAPAEWRAIRQAVRLQADEPSRARPLLHRCDFGSRREDGMPQHAKDASNAKLSHAAEVTGLAIRVEKRVCNRVNRIRAGCARRAVKDGPSLRSTAGTGRACPALTIL